MVSIFVHDVEQWHHEQLLKYRIVVISVDKGGGAGVGTGVAQLVLGRIPLVSH